MGSFFYNMPSNKQKTRPNLFSKALSQLAEEREKDARFKCGLTQYHKYVDKIV